MNITAVVETTENCNLNCTFCLRPSFKSSLMSVEVLEKVIKEILKYSDKRVDFIWHGGEPLMAGIDFFKKICEFQKKYNKKKIKIFNNVQTNGTLLNKEFVDFFERNNFFIGTSVQGIKEIHDKTRVTKNGDPTYEVVMKKISKLKQKPSSIVVLTKEILGREKEIYYNLKEKFRGIRISEYFPRNGLKDPLIPSAKEMGESLVRFYEVWKRDNNPIDIRPITEIIRSFVIGKNGGCLYSQESCNLSILGVKNNGDFYTCLRCFPNKNFFLGNINSCSPLKNRWKVGKKMLNERISNLRKGVCKDCRFWEICNGGCPQESLKLYGDLKHKTFYCNGRKILFEHILKDLKIKWHK